VRHDAVNAMLLNEFLKEHSTVQELKKEIATLTATVKEQASQIQKVSASPDEPPCAANGRQRSVKRITAAQSGSRRNSFLACTRVQSLTFVCPQKVTAALLLAKQ